MRMHVEGAIKNRQEASVVLLHELN